MQYGNSTEQGPESVVQAVPDSLVDSAGFLLGRTTSILRERVTLALSPLGLSPRELGLLKIMSAEGPLTQQALGKKHNTDRTTIVQSIDQLERRDLVVRVKNTSDRRSYMLHLTPRGKKTLALASRLAQREQERFLAALSESEWGSLR